MVDESGRSDQAPEDDRLRDSATRGQAGHSPSDESDRTSKGWYGYPPGPESVVLGDATHVYRGWDRETLYDALTTHRGSWMYLHPGEIVPDVLQAERPNRVVWSSFWPAAPEDTVELLLDESRGDTSLRWVWRSPTPPDDAGVGISRQRLNTKLGGDVRGWLAHVARSYGGDPAAE